jgi:hypothetical protein
LESGELNEVQKGNNSRTEGNSPSSGPFKTEGIAQTEAFLWTRNGFTEVKGSDLFGATTILTGVLLFFSVPPEKHRNSI